MAYATYTTRAIVCGSRDSYTSDRSYLLFTERAGMLWASARSVRTEASKQRPALQDFSLLRVSLVRGKHAWRIGSAEALGNPFLAATSRAERGSVSYLVKHLRRYITGEGAMQTVFNDVWTTLPTLAHLSPAEQPVMQSIFTLRLLAALGYIEPKNSITPLLEASDSYTAWLSYDATQAPEIERLITAAGEHSHL